MIARSLPDLDQRHSQSSQLGSAYGSEVRFDQSRFPTVGPSSPAGLVAPGHEVHFIVDAVMALDLSAARVNERAPDRRSKEEK